MTYFNDFDTDVIKWLNKLSEVNYIQADKIDDRSIKEVKGSDIGQYDRCHFFAGIGGWELALELAGWPEDKPVWTGSCPCQPFSTAGKGKGTKDERHLWPEFRRLIEECKPSTIFGEQVASKAGREWLDRVQTDLEALGYAVGTADLCSAGVGSPNIRQRLYWVADAKYMPKGSGESNEQSQSKKDGRSRSSDSGIGIERLGDSQSGRLQSGELLENQSAGSTEPASIDIQGSAEAIGMVDSVNERLEGYTGNGSSSRESRRLCADEGRPTGKTMWDNFDVVRCVEPTKEPGRFVEKWRRVECGTLPLAPRLPKGVELSTSTLLKGYGNSICPQVAAEFIGAFMECLEENIKNGNPEYRRED